MAEGKRQRGEQLPVQRQSCVVVAEKHSWGGTRLQSDAYNNTGRSEQKNNRNLVIKMTKTNVDCTRVSNPLDQETHNTILFVLSYEEKKKSTKKTRAAT